MCITGVLLVVYQQVQLCIIIAVDCCPMDLHTTLELVLDAQDAQAATLEERLFNYWIIFVDVMSVQVCLAAYYFEV